jgi:hypothetical protein
MRMAGKSLKELRAQARARGLKGYSKLRRDALERLLAMPPAACARTAKRARDTAAPAEATSPAATVQAPAASARGAGRALGITGQSEAPPASTSTVEERVESAKYAMVMPGAAEPPVVTGDLAEDLDRLPLPAEATLCLLPQKPGIVHGYWVVPPQAMPKPESLRLRLGRLAGDTFEILEEIALPQARGHWYFHLDETADLGAVYLQLGYYAADGRFVTAIRRGIARVPNLYAAERTDRLWWVSEERFRAMYLRAGGFTQGARLGWAASLGSPGGVPHAPSSERLAWPGGVSSRQNLK